MWQGQARATGEGKGDKQGQKQTRATGKGASEGDGRLARATGEDKVLKRFKKIRMII